MESVDSFQTAWDAYQREIENVTRAGVRAAHERGGGAVGLEAAVAGGDPLIARAEDVRNVLVAQMMTAEPSQRELAGLKLLAAAAQDLSLVGELLDREAEEPVAAADFERSVRGGAMASGALRRVLETPLDAGMHGLLVSECGTLPNDPAAARAALEATITAYLEAIPRAAASLGQTAVAGLVDVGLGPGQEAASVLAQEIMAHVPSGVSWLVRRAAQLAVEAVRKLMAALSAEQQSQALEQVKTWLDQLKNQEKVVAGWLDALYESKRLGQESHGLVAGAPASTAADRYNQATRHLDGLLAAYDSTHKVLEWELRIMAWIKPSLLAAVPWGPIVVSGVYTAVLGYAVYSGGDYLDWYRVGDASWLDRVAGLRSTVRGAGRRGRVTVNGHQ